MRFKQCCMVVMNPTTTTRAPFSGYGPVLDIDLNIENDLNIPDPENPINDIDLAGGQVVNRPEFAAVTAEEEEKEEEEDTEPGTSFLSLCSAAALQSSDLAAHPEDCTKFISCQRGAGGEGWLTTVRECSPGLVWDTDTNQCNYRQKVARCQTGQSRTTNLTASQPARYLLMSVGICQSVFTRSERESHEGVLPH